MKKMKGLAIVLAVFLFVGMVPVQAETADSRWNKIIDGVKNYQEYDDTITRVEANDNGLIVYFDGTRYGGAVFQCEYTYESGILSTDESDDDCGGINSVIIYESGLIEFDDYQDYQAFENYWFENIQNFTLEKDGFEWDGDISTSERTETVEEGTGYTSDLFHNVNYKLIDETTNTYLITSTYYVTNHMAINLETGFTFEVPPLDDEKKDSPKSEEKVKVENLSASSSQVVMIIAGLCVVAGGLVVIKSFHSDSKKQAR